MVPVVIGPDYPLLAKTHCLLLQGGGVGEGGDGFCAAAAHNTQHTRPGVHQDATV